MEDPRRPLERDFAYFEEFGKPTVEDNWPQILAMLLNSQGRRTCE